MDLCSPSSIVFSGSGVIDSVGVTSDTSVWLDEIAEEDADEPTVGVLAGEDFRSRQTNRTFLNTVLSTLRSNILTFIIKH